MFIFYPAHGSDGVGLPDFFGAEVRRSPIAAAGFNCGSAKVAETKRQNTE